MDLWPNYAFMPDGKSLVFCNKGKIRRLDLASWDARDPLHRAGRAPSPRG